MSFPQFGEIIEEASSPNFQEFGEVIEKKPSLKEEVSRHTARTGSRVAESLLGLPADVLGAARLGAKGLEKSAGKLREKAGLNPLNSGIKKPGLPGSAEIKELSSKLFGEKVLPQSKTEYFIDDIISDAAALAIPVKGKIPFLRSIGGAIAGNVAGKAASSLGGGEKSQTAAKLGAFFLSGLAGKGSLKKYWNNEYRLAEEAIPPRERLNANKLDRKLDRLSYELRKGGVETPSQRFVEKPLRDLKRIINDGEMKVEDAVAAKKKINELRAGLFDEVKGKGGQKYARTKINDISKYLDETLEKYGKENPKFLEHYNAANEAYGGFQQSKKVGNWVRQTIPFAGKGKIPLLIAEAIFKPAALKATLPAYAAFKGGELLTRMLKNPTLRSYYGKLIKNAVGENKAGFIKNIRSMEKEIKENDPDLFSELASQENGHQNSN